MVKSSDVGCLRISLVVRQPAHGVFLTGCMPVPLHALQPGCAHGGAPATGAVGVSGFWSRTSTRAVSSGVEGRVETLCACPTVLGAGEVAGAVTVGAATAAGAGAATL